MPLEKPKGKKYQDVDKAACLKRAEEEFERLRKERIEHFAERIKDQCFLHGYLPEQVHLTQDHNLELTDLGHDGTTRDGISIEIKWAY